MSLGLLVGKHCNRVDLDLQVRCPQCGYLDLGAGGKSSGKAFEADLTSGSGLPQVGNKTGHPDHVT